MVKRIADTVLDVGLKKDYYGKRYDYSHFVPATKGKEGKSSKHSKLFRETAKKFSAAQIGDF